MLLWPIQIYFCKCITIPPCLRVFMCVLVSSSDVFELEANKEHRAVKFVRNNVYYRLISLPVIKLTYHFWKKRILSFKITLTLANVLCLDGLSFCNGQVVGIKGIFYWSWSDYWWLVIVITSFNTDVRYEWQWNRWKISVIRAFMSDSDWNMSDWIV